jgi:serine/threonine protein kinase
MTDQTPSPSLVGSTLGSYRVVKALGVGGMGAVYEAEHQAIGRRAAIKVLHPMFANDADVVQRFFNEARAANMVRHQSIVDIYDYGQDNQVGAYLVMEFLEGESLEDRLQRVKRVPPRITAQLLRRIASPLQAAHDAGIIHRDLKPANIFLLPDVDHPGEDRVKLLDFGIAKLTEASGVVSNQTATGTLLGTPLYMSPEQCKGAKVDHRADVYALGVIAYEMLCGRPPFYEGGFGSIITDHITKPPPKPSTWAKDIPQEVEAAVMQALAKEPGQRYGAITALANAVSASVRSAGLDGTNTADQSYPNTMIRSGSTPRSEPEWRVNAGAEPSGIIPKTVQPFDSVGQAARPPTLPQAHAPNVPAAGPTGVNRAGASHAGEAYQPTVAASGPVSQQGVNVTPATASPASWPAQAPAAAPASPRAGYAPPPGGVSDSMPWQPPPGGAGVIVADQNAMTAGAVPASSTTAVVKPGRGWPMWFIVLLSIVLGAGAGAATFHLSEPDDASNGDGNAGSATEKSIEGDPGSAVAHSGKLDAGSPSVDRAVASTPPASTPPPSTPPASTPPPSAPPPTQRPPKVTKKPRRNLLSKVPQRMARAYRRRNYRRVLQLALQHLQRRPHDKPVLTLVGVTACRMGQVRLAHNIHSQLRGYYRRVLVNGCRRSGVPLGRRGRY